MGLDRHGNLWYNGHMNYTACFTATEPVDLTRLDEEARVLTGTSIANVQAYSDDCVNFTISDVVPSGIDAQDYFQTVAHDMSKFLKVKIELHEIIMDD